MSPLVIKHRICIGGADTGWRLEDGEQFDTTLGDEPCTFETSSITEGWTQALKLLTVGEQRRFWIPSHLACASHRSVHCLVFSCAWWYHNHACLLEKENWIMNPSRQSSDCNPMVSWVQRDTSMCAREPRVILVLDLVGHFGCGCANYAGTCVTNNISCEPIDLLRCLLMATSVPICGLMQNHVYCLNFEQAVTLHRLARKHMLVH